MKNIKLNEIFLSLDGEGSRSGYMSTFIRLFGCNLDCPYCDSIYACKGDDYSEVSIDYILSKVNEAGSKRVTLTGGEPLDRPQALELVKTLSNAGYEVNIETNGTIDPTPFMKLDNVMITMDYKTISSGMSDEMVIEYLEMLRDVDDLKFVVGTTEDLMQMCDIILNKEISATIFVSPIFGKIKLEDMANFLINNKIDTVRMQLQMHKFIWEPDKRGV